MANMKKKRERWNCKNLNFLRMKKAFWMKLETFFIGF